MFGTGLGWDILESRNSEIPKNNIIDNFQSAMELMPQEVEELVDKVTNLQYLPFEILQFDKILARNAGNIVHKIVRKNK